MRGPAWGAGLLEAPRTRAVVAALAVLVGLSGAAATLTLDAAEQALTIGAGPPSSVGTVPVASTVAEGPPKSLSTTTTTAPTVVTQPAVPRPSRGPSGPSTPAPRAAAPRVADVVATVDQPGLYVLDVASGALQRIDDPVPFDVAGDVALVGHGLDVVALPLSGGPGQLRYRLPPSPVTASAAQGQADLSREAITHIEASPNGHAVVTAMAPLNQPANGSVGATRLVGPEGAVRAEDLLGLEFEWSSDSGLLATNAVDGGLELLRPNGERAALLPGERATGGLCWARDGRWLYIDGSANVVRVDVTTAARDATGLLRQADAGPDGRVVGEALAPDGTGVIDVWDPNTGQSIRLSEVGANPRWSPDGQRIALLEDEHIDYGYHEANQELRVLGLDGRLLTVVTPAPGLTIPGDGGSLNGWTGPQWVSDSSRIAFIVTGSQSANYSLPS